MNKQIDRFTTLLDFTEDQSQALRGALKAHRQYAAIEFDLVGSSDEDVRFQLQPGQSFHQNQASERGLVAIAREKLQRFIGTGNWSLNRCV